MARHLERALSQQMRNANAVVSGAPLTIAGFLKTTDLTVVKSWASISNAALTQKFVLYSTGTDAIRAGTFASSGGSESNTGANVLTSDTWAHIGGVFAAATSRIAYFNGVAGAENTVSRVPAGLSQTILGGEQSSDFAIGDFAHWAVWNAALTSAEMLQLTAGNLPTSVRFANLVSYWPLAGDASPEPDVIGGFDLTLINSPTKSADPPMIFRKNLMMLGIG